jgi:hypothetical protein
MSKILTSHLVEIVETLHTLRLRMRHTARVEVARAISEALRETTMDLICGPARYPSPSPASYPAWDDPWQEPPDEPWGPANTFAQDEDTSCEFRPSQQTWHPAVMAGLGAARWSFLGTRQIGPALLLGLVVVLVASVGGPTVNALLEAWLATTDLLTFPLHSEGPDFDLPA